MHNFVTCFTDGYLQYFPLKLPSGEWLETWLMINLHWFGSWLGAIRQQTITFANVYKDLWHHLGQDKLTNLCQKTQLHGCSNGVFLVSSRGRPFDAPVRCSWNFCSWKQKWHHSIWPTDAEVAPAPWWGIKKPPSTTFVCCPHCSVCWNGKAVNHPDYT